MPDNEEPEPSELSDRDRELAALLASGLTQKAAGERLDISLRSVARAVAKKGFRQAVSEIREAAAAAAAGKLVDGAAGAADELLRLTREAGQHDAVRVSACRATLDFALRFREQFDLAREMEEVRELIEKDKAGWVMLPASAVAIPPAPAAVPAQAEAPEPEPRPEFAMMKPADGAIEILFADEAK